MSPNTNYVSLSFPLVTLVWPRFGAIVSTTGLTLLTRFLQGSLRCLLYLLDRVNHTVEILRRGSLIPNPPKFSDSYSISNLPPTPPPPALHNASFSSPTSSSRSLSSPSTHNDSSSYLKDEDTSSVADSWSWSTYEEVRCSESHKAEKARLQRVNSYL